MIVALDLGNTRLKWGLHRGDLPVAGRFLAEGAIVPGEPGAIDALPARWSDWGWPEAIVACSVAGSATDAAVDRIAACLSVPVHRIRPVAEAAGVRNLYGQPASLGADRWAALAGARARTHGAALVVDAGTAMTVDALAADGRFLGGLIVPGYDLMRASLARGTARLPVATGRFDPFPRSTDDAIVTGALQAMAGAVVRTYDAMVAAGEVAPCLLLTGGCAPLLREPLSAYGPVEAPALVLEGLLMLARGGCADASAPRDGAPAALGMRR
ncbi:MAG: type III pantothenate kinase [bacterium]|jgi:type III pantothenate kinase|nr:type III pantothenate kinase [Betaproteobacteria bacterium]